MKKKYPLQIILFLLVFILCIPTTASANIQNIINQVEKSYERQIAGIQDITIVHEMKSAFFTMESTQYQKKFRVNNQDILKTRTETSMMGMDDITIYDGEYTWTIDVETGQIDRYEGTHELIFAWKYFEPDKMQYLGEEAIDGKGAYKIYWDDAIWMGDMAPSDMMDDDMEEVKTEMHSTYWIDKKDYVPLKVQNVMKSTGIEDGSPVTMNMISDVHFQDYRTVGSMLIPYKIIVSTAMEFDDPRIEEEDEDDFGMDFMSLIEAMGKMEINVTSVELNTGLSDDLFDGTKLIPRDPMFGDMPDFEEMEDMTQEDIEAMMEGFMEGFMDMMKEFIPED